MGDTTTTTTPPPPYTASTPPPETGSHTRPLFRLYHSRNIAQPTSDADPVSSTDRGPVFLLSPRKKNKTKPVPINTKTPHSRKAVVAEYSDRTQRHGRRVPFWRACRPSVGASDNYHHPLAPPSPPLLFVRPCPAYKGAEMMCRNKGRKTKQQNPKLKKEKNYGTHFYCFTKKVTDGDLFRSGRGQKRVKK